jgi:hypothetical protein
MDPEAASTLAALARDGKLAPSQTNVAPPNESSMKALQALGATMLEVQAVSRRFEEARGELNLGAPIDATDLKTRQDLGRRRDAARAFLAANTELHDTLENLAGRFREKLEAEGMSGPQMNAYVESAAAAFEQTLPTQRKLRTTLAVQGKTWIELCDLLEGQWGKWSVQDGVPKFESEEAAAKFAAIQQRFERAQKSQEKAGREFLNR